MRGPPSDAKSANLPKLPNPGVRILYIYIHLNLCIFSERRKKVCTYASPPAVWANKHTYAYMCCD